MGTAAGLLDWAREQLGVTEDPPNTNQVKYWNLCGQPGAEGQPWCAAFVLAGLLETRTIPTTASVYVPTIETDYARAGTLYPIDQALPGDQVLYNIGAGHTGIVVSVNIPAETVTAIEGNTSPSSSGSQDNGGGVYEKTRPWYQVNGAGRPVFDSEDDTMADSDVVAEARMSERAWYQLQRDGGVRVVDAARGPLEDEPFHAYTIVANTGQAYWFAPELNRGVFSYPGLPEEDRQGDRYFVAIYGDGLWV